jgi:hypothetical protein
MRFKINRHHENAPLRRPRSLTFRSRTAADSRSRIWEKFDPRAAGSRIWGGVGAWRPAGESGRERDGFLGLIFTDAVIATAILDRLIHHAHMIAIPGVSFRMKAQKSKQTKIGKAAA